MIELRLEHKNLEIKLIFNSLWTFCDCLISKLNIFSTQSLLYILFCLYLKLPINQQVRKPKLYFILSMPRQCVSRKDIYLPHSHAIQLLIIISTLFYLKHYHHLFSKITKQQQTFGPELTQKCANFSWLQRAQLVEFGCCLL